MVGCQARKRASKIAVCAALILITVWLFGNLIDEKYCAKYGAMDETCNLEGTK